VTGPGAGVSGFDVHGAWMRRSAAIDDGPAFETQFVIWLQAGSCYADVRVPLHPAADERCFAGRSGWEQGMAEAQPQRASR
jgi:hypothetical protein